MLLDIRNNTRCLLTNSVNAVIINLLFIAAVGAQQVPKVSLTIGETNTAGYGRNYGEVNAVNQIDFSFTAAPDSNYTFSWQAYDIEAGELVLYLNNKSVRTLEATINNLMGEVEQVSIPQADLLNGENILSFRAFGGDGTWGVTNLLIEQMASPPTQCTYPCPVPNSGAPLYSTDGDIVALFNGDYGNAYGDIRTYNLSYPLPFTDLSINESNFDSTTVARDIIIRFTEKRDLGNQSAIYSHFTNIYVNDVQVANLPASFGEFQKDIILSRNLFSKGRNVVRLSNQSSHNFSTNSGPYIWGVKDVQMEYLPKISLLRNQANPVEYGSAQMPARLTGLRATVNLPTIDNVELSLQAWDVDIVDELEVYVNGKSYGFLTQSNNDQYNVGDTLAINSADLRKGENQIELALRRPANDWIGEEDEKWRIKDIKITGSITMAPTYLLLLDD